MRWWAGICLLLLAVAWTGCSDGDGTGTPTGLNRPFELILTVVTPNGDPVAGVSVGSVPAVPAEVFPWGPRNKSAVSIPFTTARAQVVRLAIRDVNGGHVRMLMDQAVAAGRHVVMWDGRDDGGRVTPPGYYTTYLWGQVDGEWESAGSRNVLQMTFDPNWWSWGETDSQGQLIIRDSRMVPGLYDIQPLVAVDEQGNEQGSFVLTGTTWLALEAEDRWQWAVVEITSAVQSARVVWDPDGAPAFKPVGGGLSKNDDVVPAGDLELGMPYPNPFN